MKYPIGTKLRRKINYPVIWHCCVTGYNFLRGTTYYKLDWYKNGAFEHKNTWTEEGVCDYLIPIAYSVCLDEELFIL